MIFKNTDYFKAIVEKQSITKAAQSLYISQPALSFYLAKLEEELGMPLFNREKQPLELTYAGKLYYNYLLRYENLLSHAQYDFKSLESSSSNSLNIGIPHWFGIFFLGEVLSEFTERFPYVTVNIIQGGTHDLERKLKGNLIEFGIIHTPYYSTDLTYEILQEERILLLGLKDHPAFADKPTSFAQPSFFDIRLLKDETFMLTEADMVLNKTVRNLFSRFNMDPRVNITCSSTLQLTRLAACGLGFTFAPEFGEYFPEDLEKLAFYTIDTPPLTWTTSAVYNRDCILSLPALEFIRITKHVVQHKQKMRELGQS